jgi:uncharacterized membrane protein
MNIRHYFSQEEKDEIVNAIGEAELNTSGEIRIHIEKYCKEDVLDRAAYIFKKLEMHNTALRNGILFYLAVEDRKFALLADRGINQKVPENTWEEIKDNMASDFRKGSFSEGLAYGIRQAGELLKQYFPHLSDDKNELRDDISFGENI